MPVRILIAPDLDALGDPPPGCEAIDCGSDLLAAVAVARRLDPCDLQTLKLTEIGRIQTARAATAKQIAVPVHPAA